MSSLKSVATKIDWAGLGSKLKPETLASLNVFRRRHADLSKTLADLKEQDMAIDFAHYRSVLKNRKVVDNAEASLNAFKGVKYDLEGQLKLIQQHEAKAVEAAEQMVQKVSAEVNELKTLIKDIDESRPLDQLTTADVVIALPGAEEKVKKMAARHQWIMPGYFEKFGSFKVGF